MIERLPHRPEGRHGDEIGLHDAAGGVLGIFEASLERRALQGRQLGKDVGLVLLIEDLDKQDQSDILAKLPSLERAALERSLEYPEDSAGRIMQTDLIAVPPFWSVGQTLDHLRDAPDLPDRFYEIFV